MTCVKLTPAELRLLELQSTRGIPYRDDIFAWRGANAAAIAALESQIQTLESASSHPNQGLEVFR
jgi:hypothetical protein